MRPAPRCLIIDTFHHPRELRLVHTDKTHHFQREEIIYLNQDSITTELFPLTYKDTSNYGRKRRVITHTWYAPMFTTPVKKVRFYRPDAKIAGQDILKLKRSRDLLIPSIKFRQQTGPFTLQLRQDYTQ